MADVLDIDNAEEFEVDEDGDREYLRRNRRICNFEVKSDQFFRGNRSAKGEGPETQGPWLRQR